MLLQCVRNSFVIKGPRYFNETDEELTQTVPLTIGKVYDCVLQGSTMFTESDFTGNGAHVYERPVILVYNDKGEVMIVDTDWFQPRGE